MKTILVTIILLTITFCITYFSLILEVEEYEKLRNSLEDNFSLSQRLDSLQNVCDSLQTINGYLEVEINKSNR